MLIRTGDNYVVVARQPDAAHIYPGRWTFAASGTLLWGASPHPFLWAGIKSYEELRHQVDNRKVRLISIGADARKLYFNFCFVAETQASFTELQARCGQRRELREIALVTDEVVSALLGGRQEGMNEHTWSEGCWEPAAEPSLLTLCAMQDGWDSVSRALSRHHNLWGRRSMLDEWDHRASRPGDAAVMSVRYMRNADWEQRSEKLAADVVDFMQEDIVGARVLEVGAGTGRITERLVRHARHVTAIELCERMKERCEERLKRVPGAGDVTVMRAFAQDYVPLKAFDVAVCCLVLIHNTVQADFDALVETVCRAAKAVYVFEDITEGRLGGEEVSPYTALQTEEKLVSAFDHFGFEPAPSKRRVSPLFEDQMLFMKLVPRSTARN